MRVRDLILRRIAKRCVSKDEAVELDVELPGASAGLLHVIGDVIAGGLIGAFEIEGAPLGG
jgi:hypothetical protein